MTFAIKAQLIGTVSDNKGTPLPFVTIHIENTYTGTTTNEQGKYNLDPRSKANLVVVFQYLGYKTQKINYVFDGTIKTIDVQLEEENIQLKEVVIDVKINPANEVIRNAIASKKENSEHTNSYKADFYSRGIFRIKDAPKKILGQTFDSFDEILDTTRSGILYLSETISKITYKKPDKLKEVIVASKVSGKDNGYSFNNAASVDFDFYDNYLPFEVNAISPIANNAFNYYNYKLEGTFFDANTIQINKIKVIPKRSSEPSFEGYLYIVEDSWAIYAVDLSIKGNQIQNPAINTLFLKQNFSFNSINKIWVKNSQTLDFVAGFLGINMNGRFTYVYSNYEFKPEISKRTFTKEVLSFEANANKKDNNFWEVIRPVPLTVEEATDYIKKDVLQTKKKSKVYQDSIDAKVNKVDYADVIMGCKYKNSYKKWEFEYDGLVKGVSFNTVQGWRIESGLSFIKKNEDKRIKSIVKANFDYGFDERKFRSYLSYRKRFNNIKKSELRLAAGSKVAQFNNENPIGTLVNSVSTLFFKDNYMKLYEKNFVNLELESEVINGLTISSEFTYAERKPLRNNTDYTVLKNDDLYTSNNPLLPFDYITPGFAKHNLIKGGLNARINFGQEYWTRPDGKINISNDKYPILYVGYEKGFGGSESIYDFDLFKTRLTYDLTLGNKGNLALNLKAGKFYNAEAIAFVDYQHFNGNQTHVGSDDRYLNVFNLLPYYSSSTNDSFFELHAEHDDSGYIMNKIPLLNKLKATLVLGYHNLSIPERNPYHEFTVGLNNLGFGKFKIFRLDYVHSYQNKRQESGIVFGLKILNILE